MMPSLRGKLYLKLSIVAIGIVLIFALFLYDVLPDGGEISYGDYSLPKTDGNVYTKLINVPIEDDPLRVVPNYLMEYVGGNTSTLSCTEKHSYVYIKMIKCGSTTLASLFRRFGIKRGLSCALPLGKKIYLGWPYPFEDRYCRPSLTGHYDYLVDHAVYNKQSFNKIMPRDVVYLTSIREPFSEFKSMFNYYNFRNIIGFPNNTDPVREYLLDIAKYDTIYQADFSSTLRYCIPNNFSMSQNLMSFNLGFPTGRLDNGVDRSNDEQYIRNFISTIDNEFTLVLITEYMTESLILLRRNMCWKLEDLLHVKQNVGHYKQKDYVYEDLVGLYRRWSTVDYTLYDHFNRTLWRKINQQNEDFWTEVSHFKQILASLQTFCDSDVNSGQYLVIPHSKWTDRIHVYRRDCQYLGDKFDSLQYLKDVYDKNGGNTITQPELPKFSFC